MSMEHKAFLFDCEQFFQTTKGLMKKTANDLNFAKEYIGQHYSMFCSPYTGELLQSDWEQELSGDTIQEYFDFLLTSCYDVNSDWGLGYLWDGVEEAIKAMGILENPGKALLGDALYVGDILVNPGGMGLGIIKTAQVAEILGKLLANRDMLNMLNSDMENLLYDVEPEEIVKGYDDLCNIYREALKQGKGIMFTF